MVNGGVAAMSVNADHQQFTGDLLDALTTRGAVSPYPPGTGMLELPYGGQQ
jgi:hypothetical protein